MDQDGAPLPGFRLFRRGGSVLGYAVWERDGSSDVLVELSMRGDTATEDDALGLVRALDDLRSPGHPGLNLILRPLGPVRTTVSAERVLSNWAAANAHRIALVTDRAPSLARAPHELLGLLGEVMDETRSFDAPDAALEWLRE